MEKNGRPTFAPLCPTFWPSDKNGRPTFAPLCPTFWPSDDNIFFAPLCPFFTPLWSGPTKIIGFKFRTHGRTDGQGNGSDMPSAGAIYILEIKYPVRLSDALGL
jgi:hypothetical protein